MVEGVGCRVGPVTAFFESIAGTALPGDHLELACGIVPKNKYFAECEAVPRRAHF